MSLVFAKKNASVITNSFSRLLKLFLANQTSGLSTDISGNFNFIASNTSLGGTLSRGTYLDIDDDGDGIYSKKEGNNANGAHNGLAALDYRWRWNTKLSGISSSNSKTLSVAPIAFCI